MTSRSMYSSIAVRFAEALSTEVELISASTLRQLPRAIVRAARAHREAFLRVIFIVWRDEASLRISYLCGE